MALHSRWTSGELEFYDGTQTVLIVPLTAGTLTVGEDGEGIDVKFYGDTASSYMLWDESADQLKIVAGSLDVGGKITATSFDIAGNIVGDAFYAGTTGTPGVSSTGIVMLTSTAASITIVNGLITAYTS
jgi:hypothetical protein